MNCKFATIDGKKCLVNFKTDGNKIVMVVQKMCEDAEEIEVNNVRVSDLDGGTLILNYAICLQMSVEDAALIYTLFNLRFNLRQWK